MKKNILFLLIISLFVISCDNDGDKSSVMIRQSPEALLTMYIGSPSGGREFLKSDSAQLIFRYFNYDSSLYGDMSIEFHEGMVTYINDGRKIVSSYQFLGDSLFVYKSDGTKEFIALGNMNELYLTQSFCRYPNAKPDGRVGDTAYTVKRNDLMDIEKALELSKYNSLSDMSSDTDSLTWLNVRYIFK